MGEPTFTLGEHQFWWIVPSFYTELPIKEKVEYQFEF